MAADIFAGIERQFGASASYRCSRPKGATEWESAPLAYERQQVGDL
ncbi:hypothetical protein QFZ22_005397 [Streptomyces canus]|uniref:Uncharacterized protein n=1 Tax=Streptomyces canus TaxID=58343 RepID=A0AAW8FK20_9ACTN|nr:hypothetical protein [Streptomyces canus]